MQCILVLPVVLGYTNLNDLYSGNIMIVIDHKMSVYKTFRWVLGRFGKGLAFTNLQARSEGCL